MRALITNDDGVQSPGIRALAEVAAEAGLEVLVAAPSWDSSGASASLTSVETDGRFLVEELSWEHDGIFRVVAVEASPAFIVRAALTGAFGPVPDVVLSGINHGPNTGHAVLHSGTVGAALTASTHGRPGLAVSVGMGSPTRWDTAASVAASALPWLIDATAPVVLNVNVPNVAPEDLRGFRRATLASFGAVQATVTETGRGYVTLGYTDVNADLEEGTDAALLADGFACFTPLEAVCEASHVDTSAVDDMAGAGSEASPAG